MKTNKRKVGRPALPKGEVKGRVTPIRFQESERTLFEQAAQKAGLSLSEWIRQSLRMAAEQK
jgi:hypothetical protein